MSTVLLVALLVAGVIVLTPLSDRLRVPSPVLLTMYGLVIALLPALPVLKLDPGLILPLVLPPLLFAATQRSTAREFRKQARPILLLAVGLTLASAAIVAWVAHLMGLGWGAAWVLGAVVAPPDPVAATAVARRLRLPDRIVTVLEGEGMFNDATALVLYSLAVAAAVTGHLGVSEVGLRLVLALVGGVGVGLAAGWLTKVSLAALHDDTAETTMTVAMPFAAYFVAEQIEGSGVLAVLALGLFLRSYGHPALTSGGWLLGRAVWRFADYLITGLVFVLIGFELTDVLQASQVDGSTVVLAAVVVGTLVVTRFAWMFPATALARWHARSKNVASPSGVRETGVVAWAGMRGVVTVATALALPLSTESSDTFPNRPTIVFVGLSVVLVTLVVQGLTLAPLVRWLGVGSDADTYREVVELRRRASQAGLDRVREAGDGVPEPVRRAMELQYQGFMAAQEALDSARSPGQGNQAYRHELAELVHQASEAERDVVLRARALGEVSAEVADEVLTDVEARAVRDVD